MCEDVVNKINSYLREQSQIKFETIDMSFIRMELFGYSNKPYGNKISIVFEMPDAICCNFFITYHGNQDFLSMISDEDECEYVIFKLSGTDVEGNMYIKAERITFQITEPDK